MRTLFEAGKFDEDVRLHERAVKSAREASLGNLPRTANDTEARLMNDFTETLGMCTDTFDLDTPVFELGFTSMHLIQLKRRIDDRYNTAIPLVVMLKNPTVRLLAKVLGPDAMTFEMPAYDPVITFRPSGTKTPLWLVHPGVGEVLVFVGLAQHMSDDDRPLYALRAKGFEENQVCFTSIAETVETYVAAIRLRQPRGPYAFAGYSYGAMLAFEIAKKLKDSETGDEDRNNTVAFLGTFNLPPNIKMGMRELDWNMCLLNLVYFIGLTSETYANSFNQETFRALSRQHALEKVLADVDKSLMNELGLNKESLSRWIDVAYGLQSMAVDYEPAGIVDAIDIFHCEPLKSVALTSDIWVRDHLSKWADFSRTMPLFHHVGGAHYTMLNTDHVHAFSSQLKSALEARGL